MVKYSERKNCIFVTFMVLENMYEMSISGICMSGWKWVPSVANVCKVCCGEPERQWRVSIKGVW